MKVIDYAASARKFCFLELLAVDMLIEIKRYSSKERERKERKKTNRTGIALFPFGTQWSIVTTDDHSKRVLSRDSRALLVSCDVITLSKSTGASSQPQTNSN